MAILSQAQSPRATIEGTVVEADGGKPIQDASVRLEKTTTAPEATDAAGMFKLEKLLAGKYILVVSAAGYQPEEKEILVKRGQSYTVDFALKKDAVAEPSPDIPTVSLDDADDQTGGGTEVANLLHASRDVFDWNTFNWNNFFYRPRGYLGEYNPLILNGIVFNDPEVGTAFYSEFGGLNDVFRNRENVIGIDASEYVFNEFAGGSKIDTRASLQRKTLQASYALTNRNYRQRVMLTMNTGLMPKGWAVSLSGSRRWAEEGYVPGTFMENYAWFVTVDKKFGTKHMLNLTAFASPSKRGRTTDTFQEALDLAGTNYYNPLWGYQNGQKRNSSVAKNNQPTAILRYDWTPGRKTNLTVAGYAQAGPRGLTRLDWFEAGNPLPDYNRRLPSSILDPEVAAETARLFSDDENFRQLNWESFYEANRRNFVSIEDANGIPGNSVSGNRSNYYIANQRSDSKEAGANATFRQTLTTRIGLNAGANYQWYLGENYQEMEDLLGGDFHVDVNRFVLFDFPLEKEKAQNDLLHPNKIVKQGDRFGYDYNENIRKTGAWAQLQFTLPRWQFFAGGQLGNTTFWRTGNMKNGVFSETSLGDSEKFSYNNFGSKAGATFKMNGRNYLYFNGFYGNRAPQFRDLFLAPRVTNRITPNVVNNDIRAIEGGYQLRAPYYKARITGFLTDFKNETETWMQLNAIDNSFGTVHLTNLSRRHAGVEIGLEAKPTQLVGWTFSGAANLGKYIANSRPNLYFTDDNGEIIRNGDTVYMKNYYVPRNPQTLAMLGVRYEGKQFWSVNLSFNWRDNLWYQFDPTRRIADAVIGVPKNSELWNTILDQKKAPSAWTLDFFGRKSHRFKNGSFAILTVGVNNILDKQDILQNGRDSYLTAFRGSDDTRRYGTEVIYAPGRTYFINLVLRTDRFLKK